MCSTVDPGLCSEAPVVCPLVATLRPAKPVSQLSPYLSGIKESFPGIVLHVKEKRDLNSTSKQHLTLSKADSVCENVALLLKEQIKN